MGLQTTGLLNTVTLSEFTDLVEKEFALNQEMVTTGNAQRLFILDDITDHTGNTRRYDEVDTETFGSLKREGEDAVKANVGIGYSKTLTLKRIAKEIVITFEMRRYNKAPEVASQITSLVHFCPQRTELDLTHILTFASATSYTDMDGESVTTTTGDGLALLSAVHTLSFSSSTYRNRVNGDPVFSQGGLEAAEELAVTNVLSNFGERRVKRFNAIISGDDPTTVRAIRQVLESTADIDAAHEGVKNVYNRKYEHVILSYLATTATGAHDSAKRRYWFLAAIGQGQMGWQAYFAVNEYPNLKAPAPGNNGEDIHNDNWTYGVRCGYGIVTLSGIGLIGSLAAS